MLHHIKISRNQATLVSFNSKKLDQNSKNNLDQDDNEEIEFVNLETRLTLKGTESVLTAFATKVASS